MKSLFVFLSIGVVSANVWAGDLYQEINQSIDREKLITELKNLSGTNSVTVNGKTFKMSDRYSSESKEKFRTYWKYFFENLKLQVNELNYTTRHNVSGETEGHNLEAILPGKSKDSVVVIVHYDSMGPGGAETSNPGVDDDMTGMAMMFEGARLLVQRADRLKHTIRFVAADYEEWGRLEGARKYAAYIKNLSEKEGFKVIAAVDNEQSGWNCAKDGLCGDNSKGNVFDVFTCSPNGRYDHQAIGDLLEETAHQFSDLQVVRSCIGQNSDHYAMWEIGVPAVVFSEHSPFNNPHFDADGGDTFDKIDQDYFFKISKVGITFLARLVGLEG